MIYLFLGTDVLAKDKQIAQIKQQILPSQEANQFDYEILHANKLHAADLKKALIALPAVAEKRVVLIRQIQKLSPQNKDIIIKVIEEKPKQLILLLDSDESDLKSAFITKVQKQAKTQRFGVDIKQSVFDMTNAMSARNPAQALKVLSKLLAQGDHPLQIMGALVWFWGKNKARISKEKFKLGLEQLQEADLNIKRSRLKPDYAIEVCVTKLCCLIV